MKELLVVEKRHWYNGQKHEVGRCYEGTAITTGPRLILNTKAKGRRGEEGDREKEMYTLSYLSLLLLYSGSQRVSWCR